MKIFPIANSDLEFECSYPECKKVATNLVLLNNFVPCCDEHTGLEKYNAQLRYQETTTEHSIIISSYAEPSQFDINNAELPPDERIAN